MIQDGVAFHAKLSSDITNPQVGNDVIFDDVIHNGGNHYNATSGKFTCAVSGVYLVSVQVCHTGDGGLTLYKDDAEVGKTTQNHSDF